MHYIYCHRFADVIACDYTYSHNTFAIDSVWHYYSPLLATVLGLNLHYFNIYVYSIREGQVRQVWRSEMGDQFFW